jgi:hypothetical protein
MTTSPRGRTHRRVTHDSVIGGQGETSAGSLSRHQSLITFHTPRLTISQRLPYPRPS